MTAVADASVLIAAASDGLLGPSNAAHALLLMNRSEGPVVCTHLAVSEALAAFRRSAHAGVTNDAEASLLLRNLEDLPIEAVSTPTVRARALELATSMGWARTYDAEHCALAEHVGGRLLTCDLRLRRGAEGRLPYVVTPAEILAAG